MRWVALHIPHLVSPLIAFFVLARLAFWAAAQPPSHFTDEEVEQWNLGREAERIRLNRPVRRKTSLFGLLALGPLIIAFATGLWIYTLSLRGEASPDWLVWSHVATSALGLLIVTAKAAELGWRHIFNSLQVRRPQDAIASVVMLTLGVPIAVTGVLMLFRPSGGAFTTNDYLHVVTSVWWTLIVQWHLYRYLVRATRAVSGASDAPTTVASRVPSAN